MTSRPVIEAVVEALPYGVLLLDAERRVGFANSAIRATTGRSPEAVMGRPLFESFETLRALPEVAAAFSMPLPTIPSTFVARLEEDAEAVTRIRVLPIRYENLALTAMIFEPLIDGEARLRECLQEVGRLKHAIANPLMGLMGTAELLELEPGASEATVRKTRTIMETGQRIQTLLQELGALRRKY